MIKRQAHLDTTRLPPNVYLVANGCPRLLEGLAFHACKLAAPSVPEQDKPALSVACEYLAGSGDSTSEGRVIFCLHGTDAKASGNGAQFGTPTISHYPREVNDGSEAD